MNQAIIGNDKYTMPPAFRVPGGAATWAIQYWYTDLAGNTVKLLPEGGVRGIPVADSFTFNFAGGPYNGSWYVSWYDASGVTVPISGGYTFVVARTLKPNYLYLISYAQPLYTGAPPTAAITTETPFTSWFSEWIIDTAATTYT